MSIGRISIEEVIFEETELCPNSKTPNSLPVFECNLCFTSFKTFELLKAHLIAEQEFGRDADDFLKCEDNEQNLQKPGKKIEIATQFKDKVGEKRICPKCSKTLKSFKGLEQHIAKMHMHIRKKSVCKSCRRYFKDKYAMIFHVKQVHEKSTRVVCEMCQQIMYNKYSLQSHLEKYHSSKLSALNLL